MKNTIDWIVKIFEQHNITLPKVARKTEPGEKTEYHDDSSHALKASYSKSHAFLINLGSSNHMVASRESFSSLQTIDGD